ncbi:DNA polymerase, partial [Dorea longicatena]|uniref:DNA polymerase n=1 Tax=Dorea longicatena TaxID=88431 RepID=UPI001FAB63E0
MSSKIVLIDGHSILNRAFYGLPDLTNAEGLHTNAIYGFLTIMFKLLEEEKPEYLTVAFDVHAPTFRHKMYAEYKGTRKPMADELRQQVPVIKEVLHAMGVKTIECAGLEADDLIGTLSNRCENEGMEVTVISGDRDLLQLATEHVKIRIPKTKQGKTEIEDYYAKDVEERYQVTPKEFIDLKALMGDTADNIPGVPSIGEKTATKIITQYHSIEEAHEHVDELKPPRASKALSEHWDLAVLSKELATINVKADFPYELSEAKLGNLYTEEAYIFFQKLEFKNLLSRFDVSAPANKVEDGFKIITSKSEAEKVFVQAEEASTIGAVIFKDLGNVLPLFADQAGLGGIGLCFSKEESYCIKVEKDITGEWLLKKLADVAEKAETYAMFHLKESMEQVTIRNQANCFDVSVAAYLLNPLKNNYTWEDVAREHLGLMIDEKIDQDMKACYESYVNYASVEVLRQKLRDTKMDTLFRDIEMPLVFTLFDMEQNGIRVEADALKQYGDQLAGKIAELEKEIYEEAGETFNINSPKQLGVVLFENMKLPGGRKTKTGYSTAADVLEKLA